MADTGDRRIAGEIARAGIDRVAPATLIASAVQLQGTMLSIASGSGTTRVDLGEVDRVLVLGAGKASAAMAARLELILGERIHGGCVVTKYGHAVPLSRIELREAGHPVPDEAGVAAAARIGELADQADERTLVLVLVSGGGSALLASPLVTEGHALSLEDLAASTRLLLGAGAPIAEVNCVRRHLSGLGGGRLAQRLLPARSVALVLSDVIGDHLEDIASGLVAPDPTTYADAQAVCHRYGITEQLPARVAAVLAAGAAGRLADTPTAEDPAFARMNAHIVGTNRVALDAAAQRAREHGLQTLVLSSQISGEAREIAQVYAALAREIARDTGPVARPACVLAGGETTVTLRGAGTGGRNQEMALAVLREMKLQPHAYTGVVFLSMGTDGTDGPTDAAGGMADVTACAAVELSEIERALADNNAYPLLDAAGALIRTGPTMTNVCDLQVLLVR